MTENLRNPKPSGEHKLLRWILVLQIVILAWLAKNHFDGAFNCDNHMDTPVVATVPDTPPSLESSLPNAPSFFSPLLQSRPRRQLYHPVTRMRAEMERMMSQADRAFANFDSLFGPDAAWASVPTAPAMNMSEREDAYELSLALPDTDPDSLDVHLDGRILNINARQDSRTPTTSSSQRFHTRLLMPGPVDPAAPLQITNENNRIRIRIPKPDADTASRTP